MMKRVMALMAVLALVSSCTFMLVGCARNPAPTGTPEARAFNADQLLKDIAALQSVAASLNTAQGQFHITDKNLQVVNDFASVATAAVVAYQNGSNTLGLVLATYHSFIVNLSGDVYLNDSFKFVLQLVDAGIKLIPGSVTTTVQ